MHIEIYGKKTRTIDQSLPLSSPRIVVTEGDVENRDDIEACQIDVENEAGEIARFWVSVSIVRGRPKVRVATKPDKNLLTQVNKVSTGTFNIVRDS